MKALSIFDIIFLVRTLLLLQLLTEFQQFYILVELSQKLTKPFFSMGLVLYTVFFLYIMIGQAWFGGKISTTSAQINDPGVPALYSLLNFNDFASGFITLFTLMVINNWFVTTDMLCDVAGNTWPRVFTIVFILTVTWVMLSVIIAFILEIHGVVVEETEKEWRRREFIANLRRTREAGGMDKNAFGALRESTVAEPLESQ